jgi:hypothetical protein
MLFLISIFFAVSLVVGCWVSRCAWIRWSKLRLSFALYFALLYSTPCSVDKVEVLYYLLLWSFSGD